MKKALTMLLISGFALSSSFAFAGGHNSRGGNNGSNGSSSPIVGFAAANPKLIQTAAGTIASIPPAQAAMDKAMEASPQANSLMLEVQQAGGYTPAN